MHVLTRVHVAIYRLTGGRLGGKLKGVEVLLLDHVGRKSGKRYSTPLLYMRDGENVVIVASKGGNPRHPAWWLNIRDAGRAEIEIGRKKTPVTVTQATAEEKEQLWPKLVAIWPDYQTYQDSTEREIPVAILTPA